jgi:hypothetical protein
VTATGGPLPGNLMNRTIRYPAAPLLAAALFLVSARSWPQEDQRLAVPDAAAQKDAEKVVRDVFKDDYARKAAPDRVALAKKLLEQGLQTREDPASKYVLLRDAQDLASQGGNIETALQAIAELSKQFRVDSASLRSQALTTAGQVAKNPDEFKALALASLKLAGDAVSAEDYDGAGRILGAGAAFGKKAKDIALVSRIDARTKEASELKARLDTVKRAKESLAVKPDDPQARSTVGWYLCAVKGDWEAGLALLEGASDEGLKAAAAADRASPSSPQDQASLGDRWWDLAEKQRPAEKEILRRRSTYWYEQSLAGLSGLGRAKVEKRLAEAKADRLAREGWVDVTDASLFGLPGRKGDPLTVAGNDKSQKKVELSKLPPGEFEGFSARITFGKGDSAQARILLEGGLRELYVQNGSVWSVAQADAKSQKKQDFMFKGEKHEQYTISGSLIGGEYVFTVDGKEAGRAKTAETRLTSFGFLLMLGEFKLDELRLKRKE